MTGILLGAAGVLVLALVVVWAGHRMVTGPRDGTAGAADALGNFIDVFDPARARADRDLQSKEHQGDVLPSPDDADLPVRVDLDSGTAHIRKP